MFSWPSDTPLSIVCGPALDSEPGLGPLTLPAYLNELAERFAAREALVFHEADGSVVRWSYEQLREQALGVAKALAAAGLPKGCVVGVLITNRPEWLASLFGIVMAGGVAAPLSTFSTPSELDHLLRKSCASTLIVECQVLKKDFVAIIRELEPVIDEGTPGQLASIQFPFLRRIVAIGDGSCSGAIESWQQFLDTGAHVTEASITVRAAAVSPADPALLYFSSGSTGKPKGILNSHRGVTIQAWRLPRLLAMQDGDAVRGWGANGFFWSGAFVQTVGATLSSGGTLILQPTFNAETALKLIERERVSYIVAWPHQSAQLVEASGWAEADLSSLRFVDHGSALAKHATVQTAWREPRAAYGSTETFTLSTCFPSGTTLEVAGSSHGVPLPGNTIRIVDPITGRTLPLGEAGEIAVKGPTLMLGYIGDPLTETLDEEGYFRTGDGGYIDDQGRLFWQGRLNDIIKTGGANVSPLEIDGELMSVDGVKFSQTVGVPHEELGEMIVTCVVAQEGFVFTESGLRDRLKQRLASFKVPRRILFVDQADMSFTGSEKVRTEALRTFALTRLAGDCSGAEAVA